MSVELTNAIRFHSSLPFFSRPEENGSAVSKGGGDRKRWWKRPTVIAWIISILIIVVLAALIVTSASSSPSSSAENRDGSSNDPTSDGENPMDSNDNAKPPGDNTANDQNDDTCEPSASDAVKLLAVNATAHEQFGYSVAIYGDTAMVSAPGSEALPDTAGRVLVYSRSSCHVWKLATELHAETETSDTIVGRDEFGKNMALDGDTLVIGARGAAYIYERAGHDQDWKQVAKLESSNAANPSLNKYFASDVAIDEDSIAVGSTSESAVYVYVRDSPSTTSGSGTSIWILQQIISGDLSFGASVDISKDDLIVGTPRGDTGVLKNEGVADIFKRTTEGGTKWSHQHRIYPQECPGCYHDNFAEAVAIDGDYAIVAGSTQDTINNNYRSKILELFTRHHDNNAWLDEKFTTSNDGDTWVLGKTILDSGSALVLDASREIGFAGRGDSAFVQNFRHHGDDEWDVVSPEYHRRDASEKELYGTSVATADGRLIVGAPGNDDNFEDSGAAYIFNLLR